MCVCLGGGGGGGGAKVPEMVRSSLKANNTELFFTCWCYYIAASA